MFNLKTLFHLLALTLFKISKCDVIVYNVETREKEIEFKDYPSRFGDPIPPEGLTGLVVYSNPPEACENIEKPPVYNNYTGKWIVLIKRFECEFEQKIRNAQKAGYDAVIVHNVNSSASKPMVVDNGHGIHIPSVFIGSESGFLIKNNYLYKSGYFILITDEGLFNFTSQLLIIFSVLIGLCFFLMIFFLIAKYFKDRIRQRRNCLPRSSLKNIAIHRFKKSDPYEICAICLEEYLENDKLRVLPCSHAYHSNCIDPWLTKNRRVCPVCKRKVFARNQGATDSDSDSDTDDETAPLVRSGGPSTDGGTFTRSVANSSRRDSRPINSNESSSSTVSSASFSSCRMEFYDAIRTVLQSYSINNSETSASGSLS